jgi:TRAP-type C4-dicarboxylate transport system substrate-binding protein
MQRQLWPLRDALQKTGLVEVILYGTGSPFSNPGKFSEMVQKGILDIAYGIQPYEGSRFPLNLIISEPFLIDDNVKGAIAYDRLVKKTPELMKEFAPNHLMWASVASGDVIHTRKAVVQKLDDLKGLRVQTTNPGIQRILRALGAEVVALPAPLNYENLQKGVVDGVASAWSSVVSFNLSEVTTAHYDVALATTSVYMAMNERKYMSLPPAVKKIIDDFSTEKEAAAISQVFSDIETSARAKCAALGQTIITATPEERAALRKRFAPLLAARIKELEGKGLPAQRVYEAFLETMAEVK